jgi:hypothetical protein
MTGWLPEGQRDTAPLTRDNTRVNGPASSSVPANAADATGGPTRPAFPQQMPSAGYVSAPQPRVPYPTNRQPQPAPPASPPKPSVRGRNTPLSWVVRASILLAISVVSGLIWHVILHSSDKQVASPPPTGPHTQHPFTTIGSSDGGQSCKQVSTGKVAVFFAQHPCAHLTRALYSTTVPEGQVLTSLVTVRMPDAASAAALNTLDTQTNTGDIKPLPNPPGPNLPTFNYPYTYASQQQNELVVIAESVYFSRPTSTQDKTLLSVTGDALQLGWPQESTPK